MLDAISSAQLAMNFDQLKLQSISQNISNMNTLGFKKQFTENLGFDEQIQVQMSKCAEQLWHTQMMSQGAFSQTHKSSDIALSGDGFFQVKGEEGIFFTRRGDFTINNQGELATSTGEILLGNAGAIKVDDQSFTIDAQGAVSIDGHKVNQLQTVTFDDIAQLHYTGNGLFQTQASPKTNENTTRLLQGFLELSNVKSIDEMMDLVSTTRHFEANQRVMRIADGLVSSAINQLGEGNV